MFTENQLNKLDCMNYHITTNTNCYYITSGISGLKKLCKNYKLNFNDVSRELLNNGYIEGKVNGDNDTLLQIAMI